MPKRSLIEQLDQAIEAMLVRPDAELQSVEPAITPLLRVAAALRDLPREEFKTKLKADLQRSTSMSSTAVNPIREGFHTITPYIIVDQALELAEFVKQAFGAQETIRGTGSGGGYHIEVKVGDSMMMLGGGGEFKGTPMPTSIHLYVPDADAVYQQALRAGAASVNAPVDQPYGDREAGIKDAFGNFWWIATHKGASYVPEGMHTVTPFLHPKGAPAVIEFMKNAFGAQEVDRYESEGVVHHARVRLGNSMIEMGEAHGPYQPMPATFYLYVEDTDALYNRAIAAGAKSLSAPADQPYGDRNAGVEDPFGNQWYIGTHINDVGM